jgi:hypothetical protein
MKNATPAHSLYGRPATENASLAFSRGAKPATASGPYVGRNRCIADNDTCEGPKAKGTDFCIGHLRSMMKEQGE